jgi:hypothetical protein
MGVLVLVASEPPKFQLPSTSDLRFNWVHATLPALDPTTPHHQQRLHQRRLHQATRLLPARWTRKASVGDGPRRGA